MKTSKSPNAVARTAYYLAQQALPAYTHQFSPKVYTQHQLFAILVLKSFFTTDYRGICELLEDNDNLQDILELPKVPHFTTLQKAAKHLLSSKSSQKMLEKLIVTSHRLEIIPESSNLSAMDSTGMESHHTSRYFITRKQRSDQKDTYQTTTYKRFPKLAIICDCLSHIIFGLIPSRGPSTDVSHFKKLLSIGEKFLHSMRVLADAGYDSESNHVFAREVIHSESIMPARCGRPTDKLPSGKYRALMRQELPPVYGQRWQVETVNSMIKRNLGSELSAKSYWSQCREMSLKVLTHNIMIVV